MKFLLKTDNHGKIVEYIPIVNLDSVPDDSLLKTEEEVEEIMSLGIAYYIDNKIVYPPKEGQDYINNKWSYPSDYFDILEKTLISNLMIICDEKQADVLTLLLKHKNTPGQLQRYERNYSRAKAGHFSDEENALIIIAHETFLTTIDRYIDMIETGRKKIETVIKNKEYERAKTLMNAVSLLGKETTIAQLQVLLTS